MCAVKGGARPLRKPKGAWRDPGAIPEEVMSKLRSESIITVGWGRKLSRQRKQGMKRKRVCVLLSNSSG